MRAQPGVHKKEPCLHAMVEKIVGTQGRSRKQEGREELAQPSQQNGGDAGLPTAQSCPGTGCLCRAVTALTMFFFKEEVYCNVIHMQ